MRIYGTSSALIATGEHAVPGEHLALALEEPHLLDLAAGTAADDYLEPEDRARVDAAALAILAGWRAAFDERLTVDGVCLPFVAEWALMRVVVATLRAGSGLAAAVAAVRPTTLVVHSHESSAQALVEAVGAASGIPVTVEPAPAPEAAPSALPERASVPPLRRLRRRAIRTVLRAGAPSRLRRGAVVAVPYWPMMPLFDRLLDAPDIHLGIPLDKPPANPRRGLRAMRQGGWIGRPGPRLRRRAARATDELMAAAAGYPVPALAADGLGFDPSEALHPLLLAEIAALAPDLLARAAVFRRAYARSAPALLLGSHDAEPETRLPISLARDASVPTFLLAHGAYLMPQTVLDMEIGDEAAIWSEAVGVPGMRRDRPVHAVGYPLPPPPPRPPGRPPGAPPVVVVLGQNGHPYTTRFDERVTARHYDVALGALRAAVPDAEIVVRPHPSQDLQPIRRALEHFAGREVQIDAITPIDELLASADLCVGSLSAATLQAAINGTPVAVLNVTGFDWAWPLGGDTSVPVATDMDGLAAVLRDWRSGHTLPGSADLIGALGADRPDALDRLQELVTRSARARSS